MLLLLLFILSLFLFVLVFLLFFLIYSDKEEESTTLYLFMPFENLPNQGVSI